MVKIKMIRLMIAPLKFMLFLSFYFILAVSSACAKESFEMQRNRMVENQIISRGVKNPHVLSAMKKVERHLFVPEEYLKFAYNDTPLSIGYGQTISQPYIVAYMTEILELTPSDRVLEIGTGSGYQAAVLAEIAKSVYTIEIVPQLGKRAEKLLKNLGYKNIELRIGDGYKGWPEYAPFDAIIATCSPTSIPAPLEEQLAEGGRMIIPVGERYVQQLVYLLKKEGRLTRTKVMAVSFVPMVDEKGETY
jgi:protein-L-isoaspartate(D-aspartate) O-methyltransferase